MAQITRTESKDKISYYIRTNLVDENTGKRIRKSKTLVAPRGVSEAEARKLVEEAAHDFEKEVEEKSGGTIDVQIYPNGQLADDVNGMEQCILGTLECVLVLTGPSPLFQNGDEKTGIGYVEEMPFLFEDLDSARAAWDGEFGQYFTDMTAEYGGKVLCYWENGFRNFTNSVRPIYTPEDMKDIKFRIAISEVREAIFQALGVTAVAMPFSELFTALQQKTVQGQENPLSNIASNSFYEVQSYLSMCNYIYNTATFMVNPAWFDSLTAEEQEIVQTAAENGRDYCRQLLDEANEGYMQACIDGGMEVNEVDHEAFLAAVQPVYDKYIEKYGDAYAAYVEAAQKYGK